MSLDLARFDASTPIPANFAAVVRNEVAAINELPTLGSYRDRLAVLESFLARKSQDCAEVRRAQRFVEMRIGELIGPAEAGGDRRSAQFQVDRDQSENVLSPEERHAFRLMAAHADVVETAVERGDDSRRAVITAIRRHQREQTPANDYSTGILQSDASGDNWTAFHGDFRDRLQALPDESVDLFFTDPPYPKDDLDLYGEVAKVAAQKLGPRGRLAVYAGNLFVPQILSLIEPHLTYGWTYCLLMDNPGQSRVFGRHIIQAWKPVFVFSKGTWPSGEWHQDLVRSRAPEQDLYEWQQDQYPAAELIQRLTPPNGLVVDPFMGVGSFGVAALHAGRRFVGCEIKDSRFQTATERLGQ